MSDDQFLNITDAQKISLANLIFHNNQPGEEHIIKIQNSSLMDCLMVTYINGTKMTYGIEKKGYCHT